MYIVLSQKIDTKSSYSDELFKTYNFPARYRNQIKTGDTFLYYQGDRYTKDNRYYFGIGTIGEVSTTDDENYYANITAGEEFVNKVPIYASDGGYHESLGYSEVRKSVIPPWQSAIRPISEEAFRKIVKLSGGIRTRYVDGEVRKFRNIEMLKDELKKAVKGFYLDDRDDSILLVIEIAQEIARAKRLQNDK